ncbi:uncharacterized protein LOC113766565 [Coffea eugenioides]|uniref:uncharacterized protein LOC113757498 n=1 Tax=Coffea eugenioides TaxID=49369 RepID=UPI000F61400A|nr:uncharacterized protein LOC113757498 [Coffea eugenioides]XP_027166543.1 uncharacterized protein LOC113766565 [Coffea eugenioides]
MEGLIPMVYRSIKKSTSRRHYEHLGSGTSTAPAAQSYNIADFYANGDDQDYVMMKGRYAAADHHHHHEKKVDDDGGFGIIYEEKVKGHQDFRHRRYKSFSVDYRGGSFTPENRTGTGAGAAQSKKLVRFRSHRFFSCVTGA